MSFLTRLKVGDTVACEYQMHGGMNVVTTVTLTGMGTHKTTLPTA